MKRQHHAHSSPTNWDIYIKCVNKQEELDALLSISLQETYPQMPPIWFSESEDSIVPVIIEKLCDTSEKNYNVSLTPK